MTTEIHEQNTIEAPQGPYQGARAKVLEVISPKKLDDKKSFILPVHAPGVDKSSIDIGGKRFNLKNETHLTVIGFKKANVLKKIFKDAPEKEEAVNRLLNETDWHYEVLPATYHIQKDAVLKTALSKAEKKQLLAAGKPAPDFTETPVHKESVIRMIKMDGLAVFYRRMKDELGIDLGEVPPAHVTLYTLEGDTQGIGIDSQAEFESLNPQHADV